MSITHKLNQWFYENCDKLLELFPDDGNMAGRVSEYIEKFPPLSEKEKEKLKEVVLKIKQNKTK